MDVTAMPAGDLASQGQAQTGPGAPTPTMMEAGEQSRGLVSRKAHSAIMDPHNHFTLRH